MEDIIFSSSAKIRVRYGETDQMGYCYYGNYAEFLEVGRVEALRELGMSYKTLEEKGIMLPVKSFSIDYKYPAIYDDLLTVVTKISNLSGSRIEFIYEILNADNKVVCTANTTLVFVAKSNMKPIKVPAFFLNLFNQL